MDIDALAEELAHVYHSRPGAPKYRDCLQKAYGYIARVLAAAGVS